MWRVVNETASWHCRNRDLDKATAVAKAKFGLLFRYDARVIEELRKDFARLVADGRVTKRDLALIEKIRGELEELGARL